MRKFTIILSLTVVGLFLVGGYLYKNNPGFLAQETTLSTEPQQDEISTYSSEKNDAPKSKWIGVSYCSNLPPNGTENVGYYNNLELMMTKEGKEIWMTNVDTKSYEYILSHKDECSQMYTVTDTLSFPSADSGLTMAIDNCTSVQFPYMPDRTLIVAMVEKNKYESPDLIRVYPTMAWVSSSKTDKFEQIPTSSLTCYSNEPDPL